MVAIAHVGMVTSAGLNAAATCAALRAAIGNPTPGPIVSVGAEPLPVHRVPLRRPWQDRERLLRMLVSAISECLAGVHRAVSPPLLLCVAEPERPGRADGLDDRLWEEAEAALGLRFDRRHSATLPLGRVGGLVALQRARALLAADPQLDGVLIAGVDSLVTRRTLAALERAERLLTADNSNGFIAGEGAGAVLVERATGRAGELRCGGIGVGREASTLSSTDPLRADGLSAAMRTALSEAGRQIQEVDFRIADISGEQYFFKEAALALGRLVRVRMPLLDLWHPAECIGETGSAIGPIMLAVAQTACRKAYAPGSRMLIHCGSDTSMRAAAVLEYRAADTEASR